MDTSQFQFLTIEPAKPPCVPGAVAVKGYKKQKSGVMKGQLLAHYIEGFDSWEQASEAYPEAKGSNEYTAPQPSYNHLPPDDDPPVGTPGY